MAWYPKVILAWLLVQRILIASCLIDDTLQTTTSSMGFHILITPSLLATNTVHPGLEYMMYGEERSKKSNCTTSNPQQWGF